MTRQKVVPMDNNEITEAEITEALRESKQLAHECLDLGLLREAIAAMFNLLLLAGMSMDDCKQQTDHVFDSIGNDSEKIRRLIESWEIDGYH
jgi:hypothetical protein